MAFKTKAFNIVLPEELIKEVDSTADKEYRNRSDLIREALRQYLSNSSKGRQIHGQAAHLRESGDSIEALSLYPKALESYAKENDNLGFAEALSDEFISLRHLYDSTENRNWLILAKNTAVASYEIAKESGDASALVIPLFNLAKAQETFEEYKEAIDSYKKALENMEENPPKLHNRTGVLADIKGHLAICEYKLGDKSALARAEQALRDLEASDEAKYNKDVWTSGAYMRLAYVLMKDDPKKAREYLNKAKEIIDANPELTLRKSQLEKFSSKF